MRVSKGDKVLQDKSEYAKYDVDGDGHVDEKELDGNKHADKILKAINKKING